MCSHSVPFSCISAIASTLGGNPISPTQVMLETSEMSLNFWSSVHQLFVSECCGVGSYHAVTGEGCSWGTVKGQPQPLASFYPALSLSYQLWPSSWPYQTCLTSGGSLSTNKSHESATKLWPKASWQSTAHVSAADLSYHHPWWPHPNCLLRPLPGPR